MGQWGTCSVTSTRQAFCFGYNDFGQMANGVTSPVHVMYDSPVQVGSGIAWARFFSGQGRHFCGIDVNANGYCWGSNVSGQVGDGTTILRPSPVKIPGKWLQLAPGVGGWGVGNKDHTCGIGADRFVYCWGNGESGEIGDGKVLSSSVPVRITIP